MVKWSARRADSIYASCSTSDVGMAFGETRKMRRRKMKRRPTKEVETMRTATTTTVKGQISETK